MNDQTPVTQWIGEISIQLALISYCYRTIQQRFSADLAPYHIGWGHFAILMSLYEDEGRSQDSLALSRGFDKTMIAKSVVKLEEEGLIRREVDASDKRVRRLYLTAAGKKVRPELEKIGLTISRQIFAGMDKDEEEAALACLKKMALNAAKL